MAIQSSSIKNISIFIGGLRGDKMARNTKFESSGSIYGDVKWPEVHMSTEIIDKNGKVKIGPPLKVKLPMNNKHPDCSSCSWEWLPGKYYEDEWTGLTGHCMVTLKNGMVMIIGMH